MPTMTGVILPGNSTVQFREIPIPEPGHGEVLIRMKAAAPFAAATSARHLPRPLSEKAPKAIKPE